MTQDQEKQLAISKGFSCTPDSNRGQGWCKFSKGLLHVWRASGGRWQTALKIKNHFKGHGLFDTLEEALDREVVLHLYFEKLSKQRYYCNAIYFGWEFTIEWHHVAKAWIGEAIQSGRNRWPQKYYSQKEAIALEMAQFISREWGYTWKESFSDNIPKSVHYLDKISQSRSATPICECGAKHTSRPNHHLNFCPLKETK